MTIDIDGDLLEQLSAMLDGELDADRQRFLMQRLQHDVALRERWERWQLASGCLKRQSVQQLPPDFAERLLGNLDAVAVLDLADSASDSPISVKDAVPAGSKPLERVRSSWRWAAGMAVAASIGLAVVLLHPFATAPVASSPLLATTPPAITSGADDIPQLAVERQPIPLPMPHVELPIPVRAGVVSVYRSPLRVMAVMPSQRLASTFSPLPEPYAIDPELEAYLARQKSAAVGKRDVFSEHDVYLPTGNEPAIGTVSWSQMEPTGNSP